MHKTLVILAALMLCACGKKESSLTYDIDRLRRLEARCEQLGGQAHYIYNDFKFVTYVGCLVQPAGLAVDMSQE